METTHRNQTLTLWRALAQQNQWQLVTDEETFLDQVMVVVTQLANLDDPQERLRIAIYRTYNLLLYQGLNQRDNRAAYEIWLFFMRLALRDGITELEAENLAQEAFTRLLSKIANIHTPHSLTSWLTMLFRTTQRDLRPKRQELPLTPEMPVPAIGDLASDVETQIVTEEISVLFTNTLKNDLERHTLICCIIYGDLPRDIARELGIPLHRTRIAKSRALQRLQANHASIQILYTFILGQQEHSLAVGGQVYG